MSVEQHEFQAAIEVYDFGKYAYTVVYIPDFVLQKLPMAVHPRLRVNAVVNGHLFKGALMPDKLGSAQTKHLMAKDDRPAGTRIWYLLLSRRVLKSLGKEVGDTVLVQLLVGDQNEVDVPPQLEERLAENFRLREIWDGLTAGKKRGLVHPLNTAKTEVTRAKRLDELENTLFDL